MIALEDIRALLELALEPEMRGATVQVFRKSTGPHDPGVQFGARVPSEKRIDALARSIHATIKGDWEASSRKETRGYTIQILRADRTIEAERVLLIAGEPVTATDLQNEMMSASLLAMREAAGTIGVPFAQLKELNEFQRLQIEAQAKEIARLVEYCATLEGRREGVVETLSQLQEQRGQALVHEAQAQAIRTESEAKKQAMADIGKAVLVNAPTILGLTAKALKLGAPPMPPGLGAAAPPAPAAPRAFKAPPPMSAESSAALRQFAATLTEPEIAGLVKFAWDCDPKAQVIVQILTQEHCEAALQLFTLLAKDWGIE